LEISLFFYLHIGGAKPSHLIYCSKNERCVWTSKKF